VILKLIIFAIVGLLLYKILGGNFLQIKRRSDEKKLDEDTLVECNRCKTYVTLKESLIVDGKYYCSKECIKKQ